MKKTLPKSLSWSIGGEIADSDTLLPAAVGEALALGPVPGEVSLDTSAMLIRMSGGPRGVWIDGCAQDTLFSVSFFQYLFLSPCMIISVHLTTGYSICICRQLAAA